MDKLIVILGPTASGKSELAVKIAQKFSAIGGPTYGWNGAEIISADSRQIYKGMNIGTAKPPGKWLTKKGKKYFSYKTITHHLVDFLEPNKNFTVAEYKKQALRIIGDIIKRKKLPILAGGTGLYIKAIVDNLAVPSVPPQPKLRKKLEKLLAQHGVDYLFKKLIEKDPEAAYIIDPKNPRRLIRALEITLASKTPFSQQRKQGKQLFDTLQIGITQPKELLLSRINKRADIMMKEGLLREVKRLIKKYGENNQAFDAIGYREFIAYSKGKIALEDAIEIMKKNTWQYAKRQITWFKADHRIHWIKNYKEAEILIKKFLN